MTCGPTRPCPASTSTGRTRAERSPTSRPTSCARYGRTRRRTSFRCSASGVDDRLHFNTSPAARKAVNLAGNPAITLAAPGTDYDFTIEGTARLVTDQTALRRVAAAFPGKYPWWHPQVREGHFVAADDGQPRHVFAVDPRNVYGFGKAHGFTAARWSFPHDLIEV